MELKSLDDSSPKEQQSLLKSDSSSPSSSSSLSSDIHELEKKYAPFVRKDVYGPMGRGELPLSEKALLAIAIVTLVPIRFVCGVLILVLYHLICRFCTLFSGRVGKGEGEEDYPRMGKLRRDIVVRTGRYCARAMLFVFGFYWIREIDRSSSDSQDQSNESENNGPGAIVSNHVSHLDILYHMSASFPSFVAKRSVAKLPLVGLISKCLGCIYVQRESKSPNFKGVSGAVTERIQEAHKNRDSPMMLLFPEGTTTNGEYLLPFKTGAFLAKSPVIPVILRYPYNRFSPSWDSMSGFRHVFLLLCQFVNKIEVIRLPVYYPSEQEKEDPKLFANNVRKLMAKEGNVVLSDVGLAEKRIYHEALNGFLSQS